MVFILFCCCVVVLDLCSSLHADATLAPPRFIVSMETIEAQIGDEVLFHCEATGNPEPRILWYKSGRQIKKDNRFVIEYGAGLGDSTLVIVNVTPDTAGHYTAEAVNSVGHAYCETELYVPISEFLTFYTYNFFSCYLSTS